MTPICRRSRAQELIEKIAASDTQQLSGTVKITTDLGLPSLGGLGGSWAAAPAAPGRATARSAAAPDGKLMELASGTHTLRVAADGPDKQRLSILEDAAEYSLIHNGDEVWAYDSAVQRGLPRQGRRPRRRGKDARAHAAEGRCRPRRRQLADEALKAADDTTSVTVDGTAQVAGRDAYQLVIKPKQSRFDDRLDQGRGGRGERRAAEVHPHPEQRRQGRDRRGLHQGRLLQAGRLHLRLHPAQGREGDRGATSWRRGRGREKDGRKGRTKGPRSLDAAPRTSGAERHRRGLDAPSPRSRHRAAQGAAAPKDGESPPEAQKFLDALGDKVRGSSARARSSRPAWSTP